MARNDKHLALQLRKSGKSYNFISQKLTVPKSTLSDWFNSLAWSKTLRDQLNIRANILARKRMRLMAKANKKRWLDWREFHRMEAVKEFPKLKNDTLFVAGLMLYWAEGDNSLSSGNVRLTNTDPRMIRLFIRFSEIFCKVQRNNIRIALILYPDLDDKICQKFWSEYLKIPLIQFYKTQFIQGKHPTKRLEKGICMVKIGGVGLKEKIITWINLFSK